MKRNTKFNDHFGKLADSHAISTLILVIVSVSLLYFQNDKLGFEQWHHGFLSSHGMSIAKNLSAEHDFLMFMSAESDGEAIRYRPYNRFPIFPFLLLKTATLLGSSLSEEIYLARQLMNLFLILALVFVYLMLHELSEKRFLSLAVAIISFSSYFVLYYSDMIFNDTPSIAGFSGAMYGIAAYEKTGKRKRLFGLAIFGVSMGWQVFSLLGLWWVYRLIKGFLTSLRSKSYSFKTLVPLTATGVLLVSILFGSTVLFAALYNESRMTQKPLLSTPSARQIYKRTGLKDKQGLFEREWLDKEQLRRIAIISTPYKIFDVNSPPKYLAYVVLALTLFAPLLVPKPYKLLFITFGFSGFIWAVSMHNFTRHHDFQALYYIGIPIAIYAGLLGRVPEKVNIVLCLLALTFFVYANSEERERQNKQAPMLNQYTADFQSITDSLPPKSIIFVDKKTRPRLKKKMTSLAEGYYAVSYYLAGHYFGKITDAEFAVSRNRSWSPQILTPENKYIFLFRSQKPVPERGNRPAR